MTYAELVAPIANRIFCGSAEDLSMIPDGVVHCCVTSPPYFQVKHYSGHPAEIGWEPSPGAYVERLVAVFREVRRVLRADGVAFVNVGDGYAWRDSYGEVKTKDRIGIPWMLAAALRADGWWWRDQLIWAKPNPHTEPVDDRCTNAYEVVHMLTKSRRYFTELAAVRTPSRWDRHGQRWGRYEPASGDGDRNDRGAGRFQARPEGVNPRNVWTIATSVDRELHFAVMPADLATRCIRIGSPSAGCCASCGAPRHAKASRCACSAGTIGALVLDPFAGTGTVLAAAEAVGRRFVGVELNEQYAAMARGRTRQMGLFAG